nr:toxin VasX [uncultured Capnocytophaga sp.]
MAREFFFTVEYPGVETKISSRIELTEGSGVTLHFFRYGYFLKNSPIDLKVDYYPYILYKNEELQRLNKQLGKIAENNFYPTINARDEHLQKYEKNSSSKKNQKEYYLKKIQKINREKVSIQYNKEVETVMRKCVKQEDVEIENPFPFLDNFYVARTFLDAGYLYIFGKNDKNFFREYKVDEYGEYYPIIWREGNNRDYREPNWNPSKVIVPPDEYYFAFSRVQLSLKYIQKLRSDDEALSNRAQLINCGLRVNDPKATDEVVDPTYVSVVCDPQHPLLYSFLTLSQMAFNAAKNNSPNRFETVTVLGNSYQVYDDICITLKDPIGCANDVSLVLGEKINDLKALVASLPTGKNPENIKKEWRIQQEEQEQQEQQKEQQQEDSTLLTDVKKPTGFSTIFINALSVYHFVYGNDKNKEKYGDTVNRKMIEDLLAVNERKALRKEIIKYRRDLAYFIYTYTYNQHFHDFAVKNISNVVEGSCYCAAHLKLACTTFVDIDDHLYLRNEELYNDTDKMCLDETKRFLDSIFNKKPIKCVDYDECIAKLQKERQVTIMDLLSIPIHLGELDAPYLQKGTTIVDLSNKILFLLNATLEVCIKRGTYKVGIDILHRFKGKTKDLVTLSSERLIKALKKHGIFASHNIPDIQIVQWNLTEKNKIEEIIEEELKKAENKSKKGRKISNIEKEIKLQAEVERQTERAKNLDKLYSSKAFAKFLIGLSFLNLSIAFSQLKESPSGKNTVNFSSVAFDFSFACTKLIEIERNLAGKDVKGVKNLNKFFSKMAGLLTATYCIWEGYDAFVENDKDAAAAFVSSGALFAIAAFCGSTGVGVIIGAVAIGVYILANYWRDDEFERYFKNSWLRSDSDVKLYQKALNTPSWSYLHKIYRNRNLLMNSKNKKLVNPWKNNIHLCYQSFLNLFNKSDLKAIGISRNMESFFDDNNSIYCCTGGVDEVNIVAFPEFSDSLKNVDQFDYRIFVQNVVTKSIEEVPKGAISTPILTTENGKWCIKVDICISQWRRYKYGTAMGVKFIIAYKLQLNQEDFPYTYAGDPKYFIVSVPLHLNYREYSSNTCKPSVYYSCEFEAPVKKETVGTINQLINGKLKL